MLTAIRPSLLGTPSGPANAPAVTNPHAPSAPAAEAGDAVELSGPPIPDAAAAATETREPGKKAAIIAAGLAAATIAGVMIPVVGGILNTVPTTSISQNVTLPMPGGLRTLNNANGAAPAATVQQQADPAQTDESSQPQDPVQLVGAMAVASEESAQAMPQANQIHAAWGQDLAAMGNTAHDMSQHVDALMRNGKTDAAAHHAAIDADMAKLQQQVADFQARLTREQPAVDAFMQQNRNNLNQVGTISFNLEQNINNAASQYGYFSPERASLKELGSQVHRATIDLSMATEKATTVRADDKALADNMAALQQIIGQVQQANTAAKTDAGAMSQLDQGSRVLENAFKVLGNVTDQAQKDTQEAASRAHAGANDLVVVFQTLGGGQVSTQQSPPAAQ